MISPRFFVLAHNWVDFVYLVADIVLYVHKIDVCQLFWRKPIIFDKKDHM